LHEAFPPVLDAEHLCVALLGASHDAPDDGIETGAIAAGREDSDDTHAVIS
jgi:hypothetical protein